MILITVLQIFTVGVHTATIRPDHDEMPEYSESSVPEYDADAISELDLRCFDKAYDFIMANPLLVFSTLEERPQQLEKEEVDDLLICLSKLQEKYGSGIISSGMKYILKTIDEIYKINNLWPRGSIMPLIAFLKETEIHLTSFGNLYFNKNALEVSKVRISETLLTNISENLNITTSGICRLVSQIGWFRNTRKETIKERIMCDHLLHCIYIIFEGLEGLRLYFYALLTAIKDYSEITEIERCEHIQHLLGQCFSKFIMGYQFYSFVLLNRNILNIGKADDSIANVYKNNGEISNNHVESTKENVNNRKIRSRWNVNWVTYALVILIIAAVVVTIIYYIKMKSRNN